MVKSGKTIPNFFSCYPSDKFREPLDKTHTFAQVNTLSCFTAKKPYLVRYDQEVLGGGGFSLLIIIVCNLHFWQQWLLFRKRLDRLAL